MSEIQVLIILWATLAIVVPLFVILLLRSCSSNKTMLPRLRKAGF
jgi:uncharacterized protein (DUF983 family)